MKFLERPARFLFFTGKGGVGKTSLACAAAVRLADAGARVLLVSTDPASNVGQVFTTPIGNRVTALADVPGLDAIEIDPESAAEQYRERIVGPVRGVLPAAELASIVEQLSGSCTTEMATFNEFTAFLDDGPATASYDHVVFDTAPTGHTIRLLQLPGDWTGFLDAGGEASCLGPMSGLEKHRDQYAHAVAALGDPARTQLILVARPQASSLGEAARTAAELAEIGIRPTHLVVNALLGPDAVGADPLARAIRRREQDALAALPAALASLPRDELALQARNLVGVAALRGLLADAAASDGAEPEASAPLDLPAVDRLVEDIARAGHGLVMCMGKGGVGKTTVAAMIAVRLADRGLPVHLTTTDPAAHLGQTIAESPDLPTLTMSRIDPVAAIDAYRARVLETKGQGLDAAGRAALAEDLRSPCNQEIAVFQQFSHLVGQARRRIVVMDTAPTGHTLLLMDTTGAYHRDMVRTLRPGVTFTTPLMRLQDPDYTKVVLVTLPETTPVLEALELRADLLRAGITPWAWVVNQSLTAARPASPVLRRRAALEAEPLRAVTEVAPRIAAVPLLGEEPTGPDRLRAAATGRTAP